MKSVLAVMLLITSLAVPASAQIVGLQRFSITYDVRAHGIGVGEAHYAFAFDGPVYQANASRRSTGLARTLMGNRQDFAYAARGTVDPAGVHPQTYRHEDDHRHRVVEVAFAGDLVTTVSRPPMGMGDPPATAAQKTGALDQVSMFLQMLIARDDPCQQRLKVFMDGRSRFDLTLRPAGRQTISVPGFRGQSYRCAVAFTPIAGFSDPPAAAELTFLFAPVRGYFVPVSVEMPTAEAGIVRLEERSFNLVGAR